MNRRALLASLPLLAAALPACTESQPAHDPLVIRVAGSVDGIKPFVDEIPWDNIDLAAVIDPAGALGAIGGGAGLRVAIVEDLGGCQECFEIRQSGGGYQVHADGILGAQYGLATLLEAAGFRFHQPLRPEAPGNFGSGLPSAGADLFAPHRPDKTLRGLHLHTLHPIEGYFSHWADGPSGENAAADADVRRIHHWLVANRANYVEWVGLTDIVHDGKRAESWRARTKAIIADAHARGLRVGLGVQLFRASDLQKGFDLIDTEPAKVTDPTAEIDARLAVLEGLGFDVINVSFGEFSAFDPAIFVRSLDVAAREIGSRLHAQVVTTVHVGGLPSQRVDYMGENLPYYFLVKFADASIEPWVHSVMYYDLFEDAGGSYDMDNYDEHRRFILDRLAAGKPVGYFPETAYWITFDVSVPLYLPLYLRSRFTDIDGIHQASVAGGFGDLRHHVQFSSGFEWGYWQQDRATLRMSYARPARWQDALAEMIPAPLLDDVTALVELQHDALIVKRLAPWFAGRDSYIDLGTKVGIHSQPDRPSFADIAALDATARDAFTSKVLGPLGDFATALAAIAAAAPGHAQSFAGDPDAQEILDGIAIDAARARFILALASAAEAKGRGAPTAALLDTARAALADARAIVAHRHAGIRPLYRDETSNVTIYPFGYLAQAETLCYWERELIQITNLVDGTSANVPGCIF